MLWTYSKVILEHFLNFGCSLNCNACFTWCNVGFAWHSIITQVGKLLKHVIFLFFQSICTHYMYVSICFESDKFSFFLSLTSFAYVNFFFRKKWWAVLVMFTWIDWILTWKFNQSSVLMQNNDNFKQLLFSKKHSCIWHRSVVVYFCKPISRHPRDVISCREWEAARIFTQELYLHFSRWSLGV